MLRIAKILKSNGTEGNVLLGLFADAGEIDTKEPVFIVFDGLPVPFFIDSLVPKGSTRAIAHLTDIDSLKDAEEIAGKEIFIEGEGEAPLDEDFTGWKIYDGDRYIGDATGIEDIPGNPCLCIGDILIPLHEDFVLEVDDDSRTLRLELPSGLV